MKDSLNDTLKLAIRDEVEKRVEKRVEEAEKRVEDRLKTYWKFGVFTVGLFAAFIGAFSVAIWKVQVHEVNTQIAKALAEQKAIEAKNRILAIKTEAETALQKVNAATATVETNQQDFLERLGQIKQQDNIVFKDDVSKIFVNQTVTNFDGKQLVLDYEPLPYSIKLSTPRFLSFCLLTENAGYLRSNIFIVTNHGLFDTNTANDFRMGNARVEYLRKSLH